MTETNGTSGTVKEMLAGLTSRVEGYMSAQSATNSHLQEQISNLRTDQAVHSAAEELSAVERSH